MLPRIAEGRTVVCIASGPSLTDADVEYVRGKAVVVVVNDTVLKASSPPVRDWKGYDSSTLWADAVVSVDSSWWTRHYRQMRAFEGLKVRTHPSLHKVKLGRKHNPLYCVGCDGRLKDDGKCWCDGIVTLGNAGRDGFSTDPNTIVTTYNSGGAAINVSAHLGAPRILLLGYDMGPDEKGMHHWFDREPRSVSSVYPTFRKSIGTMVPHLKAAGIEVINCSRQTRLECFPCQPLREALPEALAVAS